MTHWLIKLGKFWSVLRQDGLLRGGRRVISAFTAIFSDIPEGDILLVSGGVGDSARYRTWHVAEELRNNGLRAVSAALDNPKLLRTAGRFPVVVLHRTLFTDKTKKYLELLKQNKVTVIFDTDDLVYDPKYLSQMDYYAKMNTLEKKLYERGVGGEILADPYVQYATTSTTFLQRKLEEKGKKVFLVTNKMSEEDVGWAKEIRESKKTSDGTVHISYLSGTPSHNKDFATITDVLCRILKEFPQARLVLAGPVDTESALSEFQSQIIRVPFAPRQEYFATVASADINVAPLEKNDFTEAKSELKFFEAGLLGVPTVAVANETYRGAITDGVDGFVAESENEWYEKLKLLVVDEELRKSMAENARKTVLAKYTTTNGRSQEYYQFLHSILK